MYKVAVWPGFRVTGKLMPEIVKPEPVTLPALMVSGAVPEEVTVTDCVTDAFKSTFPKPTLVVSRVNAGAAAPRLMA